MVTATNKKGQKQTFSDLAWRMLGKDKNGWVEQAEQTVDNSVKAEPAKLPTGEAPAQTAENAQKNEPQSVTNKLDEEKNTSSKADVPVKEGSQAKQKEFLAAIDGLSTSAVKQFLERPEVNVPYSKKARPEELKRLMAEHLKYDIVSLQKAFE